MSRSDFNSSRGSHLLVLFSFFIIIGFSNTLRVKLRDVFNRQQTGASQENLFLTDLELRTHGFVDQNNRSRRHNLDDYATGGSAQI
jgi:hypothetical protein